MAVSVDDKGSVEIALKARDEISAVAAKAGENMEKSLGGAADNLSKQAEDLAAQNVKLSKESLAFAEKVGEGLGATAVALGTVAAAVAAYGMKVGSALDRQSEKLGVTVDWLQKMQYAAGFFGKDEAVPIWVRQMSFNLAKAAETGKGVTSVIEQLGLQVEALKSAGPAQAFEQIVTALDRIPDPMDRTRIAMAVFGRGADDAIKMSKAIKQAASDTDLFRISTEGAAASNKFYDQLYRITEILKQIPKIVADDVAKPLSEMARIFATFIKQSGAIEIVAKSLGVLLRGLAVILVTLGTAFGLTGQAIGGFAAAMGALMSGNFKEALIIGKEMAEELKNMVKKFAELQGQLLGMSGGEGGMKKMGFSAGAGNVAGVWSDVLPGKELKTSANDAEYETQRTHFDRLTELHRAWQITITGLDADEVARRRHLWKTDSNYKLAVTESFFASMSVMMESGSKKAFKIGQAFAIADTIMQTYRAAQGAYAAFAWIPYVGPALGVAAAAAAVVAGMARVSAIRGLSPGGASAAAPVYSANPSTGLPAAPSSSDSNFSRDDQPGVVQAAPVSRRAMNITLVGDFFSAEVMREKFLPALESAYRDGFGSVNLRYAAA